MTPTVSCYQRFPVHLLWDLTLRYKMCCQVQSKTFICKLLKQTCRTNELAPTSLERKQFVSMWRLESSSRQIFFHVPPKANKWKQKLQGQLWDIFRFKGTALSSALSTSWSVPASTSRSAELSFTLGGNWPSAPPISLLSSRSKTTGKLDRWHLRVC